jgi:hypothetical protein
MMLGGMRLVFTATALAETDVRTFPVSRHRSKRIRKKLVKRFGGEFRKEPAIFRTMDTIYAHPSFKAEIERQFALSIDGRTDR